ncbi:MAG: VWA domain-containing protein, partial [Planctomycetes bacterium]|nr:VWA domain-containing protein [Planctomycetota bacterium]
MHLTFERPGWLLLLLTLVPVALLAWRSLPHLGRVRGTLAAVVRSLVILLLTFGLARPALVRDADAACVVVVADASRSVPAELRERAQTWLQERLQARERPSDRVGVITVAGGAEIQAVPSAAARVSILSHAGESAASDLASGLRTALAVLPGDAINRILLLSDGVETGGSLAVAADQAAAAGVPIDVVALAPPRTSEVLIDAIRTPARARRGQVVDARVVIRSNGPARGLLRLKVDERTVDLDPRGPGQAMAVSLEPGPNAFSVPLPMDRGGAVRVEASFETDTAGMDGVVENNVASAITQVAGSGRVAVVSETEASVDALLQAIRASSLEVELIQPDLLARRLGSGDFDACVLANVPRWSLDAETDRALRASVHDLGCGLLMLGGDRSFGAGGWQDSETAKAIPVEMNPPQERRLPSGALALIIDCSGSMAAPVRGTSASQQQLAAEAAIKAVRALSPSDQVTVIAFSGESKVVVPLTECANLAMIEAGIRAIEPEGGTNLFPALDAAAEQLAGSASRTRHVVVLTDGQTVGDPGTGLAKAAAMGRNGITISTVAIGDGSNDGLLARLANAADGRFYSVKDEQSRVAVPQIFIKEAQLIRRSLLWEGEPFTPTRASSAEWMRGGEGVPPIRGYVVAGLRGEPAQTGLLSPSDPPDPILAWWNHGLGRAAAFTSDLGGRWTPAWAGWSGFQPFVGGLMRWLLRPGTPGDVSIRT